MKIGLGVTGSFCTFKNLLVALSQIIDAGHDVVPVFSYVVSSFDTRFFKAKDFEDALQYFSAKAIGVDCIVTRNVKDFPFSELQVLTPKDFLAHYAVK